ncbi:hypothetical protein DL96DRAFT_1816280 [Flagelloscypha sp. PMI_526]|nr:hypothetical protein DL96DRAFT_1816280 [Flagelloscypha sp. PMI_526]
MFTKAAVFLTVALGSSISFVKATATATCGAHGMSLRASNGQSPCEIAALMVGKGAIPENSPFPELYNLGQDRYTIPTMAEADDLRCNPVFYNLVAGCAACQASTYTWSSWESWTSHCKSNTGVSYIADTMPYDTPVPNWAFTDPLATNGTFNATAAMAMKSATDLAIPDTIFNVKSDSTASSSSASSSVDGVSKGALAGGTVGGFALGVLLGGLSVKMFFSRKKVHKKNGENSSVHSDETQDTIGREKTIMQQV